MIVFGWRNPCYLDDSVLFSCSSFLSSFSSFFLLFLCPLLFFFLFSGRWSGSIELNYRFTWTFEYQTRGNENDPYWQSIPCIMTKRSTVLTFCFFRCSVIQINQAHVRIPNVWKRSPVDNQTCVSRANVARPILVNPYLDTINRVARNPSSIGNRTDNSNYSLISF